MSVTCWQSGAGIQGEFSAAVVINLGANSCGQRNREGWYEAGVIRLALMGPTTLGFLKLLILKQHP